MTTAHRLNNRKMRALRKSVEYEAVMTDLVLAGVLDKEVAELLVGRAISPDVTLPKEDVSQR